MASNSFWDMLVSQTKVAGSPLLTDGQQNKGIDIVTPSLSVTGKEFDTCVFINICIVKLELPMSVRATACWLFHKFATTVNLGDYDELIVAMTCVFLSGKLEESHVKMRDVINVTYSTYHTDDPQLQLDATYSKLADTLVDFELFLCRVLNFQLNADHPHKYLLHYLKSISSIVEASGKSDPVNQLSWSLLNDCYFTSLCVDTRPDFLAVTVCFIALKVHEVTFELEQYADKPWWKVLVDDIKLEDITGLSCKILMIYEGDDLTKP